MGSQRGGTKVDLVGVGLNATDTVVPVSAFPAAGSKTEYSEHSVLLGGEISTAVIACRRWGLRTRYIGRLGDDYAARLHRAAFDDLGVETRIVTVDDASSPQSLILVDDSGERTVLCHRDPRLTLQPADIEREWISSARALLVDGYHTTAAICAATWAREAGIPVIADLDVLRPGIDDLMPLVSNETDPLGLLDFATHHLPLEEAPHGYEIFRDKADGCIKVVLRP